MYIYRNVPFEVIWRFGWKNILFFIFYSSVLCFIHAYLLRENDIQMHIPFVLIGPVGVAVAIYSSFKNGQSYDRTWEARKNWGSLIVASKVLANQANTLIAHGAKDEIKMIIDRQLAFVNAHKLQLRMRTPHSRQYSRSTSKYYFGQPDKEAWEAEVGSRLQPREYNDIRSLSNKALQILFLQSAHLKQLHAYKQLDEFRLMEMLRTIDSCIENQGKNERIKSTPFPRQYGFFSKSFIIIFILILPFGILDIYKNHSLFNYAIVILLSTLISWLYITIELVGDFSEDPFENFITDIPMSALCNSLEIDLYEMLHEEQITPKLQASNGIIM
jgi:putative membrane protein